MLVHGYAKKIRLSNVRKMNLSLWVISLEKLTLYYKYWITKLDKNKKKP
jgi:hypothetical protein